MIWVIDLEYVCHNFCFQIFGLLWQEFQLFARLWHERMSYFNQWNYECCKCDRKCSPLRGKWVHFSFFRHDCFSWFNFFLVLISLQLFLDFFPLNCAVIPFNWSVNWYVVNCPPVNYNLSLRPIHMFSSRMPHPENKKFFHLIKRS